MAKNAKTFDYTDRWGDNMKVRLLRQTYYTGNVSLQMLTVESDGDEDYISEAYGDVTVNLPGYAPAFRCAYVDTNNLGDGIVDFLVDNGLAERCGEVGRSGFCTYPLVRFTDKLFDVAYASVDDIYED